MSELFHAPLKLANRISIYGVVLVLAGLLVALLWPGTWEKYHPARGAVTRKPVDSTAYWTPRC